VCKGAPIALIVEDDPDLREVAAAVLRQTDLRIVTCEDSEEAFATLCKQGNEVAFIFTDIHLPGVLDGVDLVHRVGVLWPRVTVIVTSGDAGARRKSLPDDIVYMPKPWVAADVLMQAWRATLRMRGGADPAWQPGRLIRTVAAPVLCAGASDSRDRGGSDVRIVR
jgi:CheY-like chemotaxis protein